MSKNRPPDLPGYEFLAEIAEGGFANVYHYRERGLDRDVAVKVLKGRKERDFTDIQREAQLMAALGQHPNIVPIYTTLMSADKQPCIVMMFCAGPDTQKLLGQGQLELRKVVRLGIAIGGAVQAAHDHHILHHDIKPSNIIIDEFNNPRLTDFGIAGLHVNRRGTPEGMSVPWSPREILQGGKGSVASDIYSLGATLYHLIAGHSPYANRTGVRESEEQFIDRICSTDAPPIERAIPTELQNLVLGMLTRDPGRRPVSAKRIVGQLTSIEQDLGAPLPDDAPWHVGGVGPTITRPRQPRVEEPAVGDRTRLRNGGLTPDLPRTELRAPAQPDPTVLRDGPRMVEPEPEDVPSEAKKRSHGWVWALSLLVVAGGVTGAVLASRHPGPTASTTVTETPIGDGDAGNLLGAERPGDPVFTIDRVDGTTVRFSWTYTSQLANDSYQWQTQDGAQHGTVATPTVDLTAPDDGSLVCVQIKVVRADGSNGSVDWSKPGCGP